MLLEATETVLGYFGFDSTLFGPTTITTDVYTEEVSDSDIPDWATDNIFPLVYLLPFFNITFFRQNNEHYIAFEHRTNLTRGVFIPYSKIDHNQIYVYVTIDGNRVEVLFDSGSGGFDILTTRTARRIGINRYPLKHVESRKPNIYDIPIDFGHGLVVNMDVISSDVYPASIIAVQELYKKGYGVTYKSNGVDIFSNNINAVLRGDYYYGADL